MKTCKKCDLEKSEDSFRPGRFLCRDCRRKERRAYYLRNSAKEIQTARLWVKNNPEKCRTRDQNRHIENPYRQRDFQRQSRYGVTPESFKTMRRVQNGKCDICLRKLREGRRQESLVIDHDHKTGRVRGLLCRGCNSGLGHFKDDLERMRKAVAYLEKHR